MTPPVPLDPMAAHALGVWLQQIVRAAVREEFDARGDANEILGTPRLAYSVREVAELLDLSENKVREEVEAGRIRAVRVGRQWRIPREALERQLREGSGLVPRPIPMPRRGRPRKERTS